MSAGVVCVCVLDLQKRRLPPQLRHDCRKRLRVHARLAQRDADRESLLCVCVCVCVMCECARRGKRVHPLSILPRGPDWCSGSSRSHTALRGKEGKSAQRYTHQTSLPTFSHHPPPPALLSMASLACEIFCASSMAEMMARRANKKCPQRSLSTRKKGEPRCLRSLLARLNALQPC